MGKYYDNIEDVRSKLLGTIVYYNETPVVVKDVQQSLEKTFDVFFTKSFFGRGFESRPLTDPGFNFSRFNIGYANYGANGAVWWYRQPAKQYQQGLKANQLSYRTTAGASHVGVMFKVSQPIEQMLLNKYPNFDEALKAVHGLDDTVAIAFHKDFAVSWDKIHKDALLEYKGKLVGHMPNSEIKLIDEFQHLYEPCKEAIGVR